METVCRLHMLTSEAAEMNLTFGQPDQKHVDFVALVCVAVQLPIVASSMVSLYFLELTDVVQPAQVGFRCHDRDLSMPYVDGGDELIPLLMLLSLAFAGPAASVKPSSYKKLKKETAETSDLGCLVVFCVCRC